MLDVISISKRFGERAAVNDVSFTMAAGEVLALLGPSGSGKSTLLSLLAGLEAPDAGDIRWDGQSLLATPTHQRGFGLMFQDYALFPHKDVSANVGFGLRMQGQTRPEVEAGVQRALSLVGLTGFEHRDVNTLSGGEQQRVALARALAPGPRLLMLDEPLGALDRALRERLLDEVGSILRRLHQTAIYVTHDQDEAFALADQVLVLRQGRVAQAGAPAEVYASPANRFVAEFLGLKNILPGIVHHEAGQTTALTALGPVPLGDVRLGAGEAVEVVLRPDGAQLTKAGSNSTDDLRLEGKIVDKSFRGNHNEVLLEVGDQRLSFRFGTIPALPAAGETLKITLGPAAIHVMPAVAGSDQPASAKRPRRRPAVAEAVIVDKLNLAGEVTVQWSGRVLRRSERELVLEAIFTHSARDLGYVRMGPGDRFVEHYYTDRWYNVFAIYDAADGRFKGWYCNITRPAEISGGRGAGVRVRAVDLALDYFRQPGGREFILDEEEFAALPLDATEANAARAALNELRALAAAGQGPFGEV